jgi:hypothetical protein
MTMSRRTWLGVAAVALVHAAARVQARSHSKPNIGEGKLLPPRSRIDPRNALLVRPSWRRAMTARTWTPIGKSTIAAINPAHLAAYNLDYPNTPVWQRRDGGASTSDQAVVAPWCGAAWDDDGGNFWLPLGGGHGDYGGNESYKICLYDDVPAWTMPKPPSGSKPYIDAEGIPAGAKPLGKSYLLDDHQERSGVYADGRPRATHSYNKLIYAPGIGPVLLKHGGSFSDPSADSPKWTWRYNETTNEWEWKTTPTGITLAGNTVCWEGSCYDAGRHCAYWLGNGTATLCRIDLTTWQWTQLSSVSGYHSGAVKLVSIPGQDKVLEVNRTEMAIWNGATGARNLIATTGTGPAHVADQFGEYGWDWCPPLGCLVCWPGHAGTTATLYTLTPGANLVTDPWTWGTLTVAGGTPPAADTNGTYGRFAYASKLNGFMILTSRTDPIWFYPLD